MAFLFQDSLYDLERNVDDEVWLGVEEDQANEDGASVEQNWDDEVGPSCLDARILSCWCAIFLNCWIARYNIPARYIDSLLAFLRTLLSICFGTIGGTANLLPKAVSTLRGMCGLQRDNFDKPAVCPDTKCNAIYPYEDCFRIMNGEKVPRRCCHVQFPNHTHHSRRKRHGCGAELVKKVVLKSRRNTLKRFLDRRNFLEKCQAWRSRKIKDDSWLGDIYDGRVWRNFDATNNV